MSDPRIRFALIAGGGEGASTARCHLAALRQLRARPEQLALPLNTTSCRAVVSIGLEAADAESLAALMESLGITKVCDVRASPSFRSRGGAYLSSDAFSRLAGIPYRHLASLANRHSGASWNELIALERYAADLSLNPQALRALGDLIGSGPLALVGRARNHHGSERAVICTHLQRLGYQFDLIMAGPAASEASAR